MRAGRCLSLALFMLTAPLAAEITPQPGPRDPRIQTVMYDPQEVVALHIGPDIATTLSFSPDERIETITLGDPASWSVQVDHRADTLVVKPGGGANTTNMTVITDQHVYNFALYGGGGRYGTSPYLVRFIYPAPATETVTAAKPAGRYRLNGAAELWPSAISDDGTATSIQWPSDRTMPAVYSDEGKRGMRLVNGLMRDGTYVIDSVHGRLVFVLGHDRASATRLTDGHRK